MSEKNSTCNIVQHARGTQLKHRFVRSAFDCIGGWCARRVGKPVADVAITAAMDSPLKCSIVMPVVFCVNANSRVAILPPASTGAMLLP